MKFKKLLLILSLFMLGGNAQLQAMSTLNQGVQALCSVGSACSQWSQANPKMYFSIIAGLWVFTFKGVLYWHMGKLENQKEPNLTGTAKAEIKKLFNEHGFDDVLIVKGDGGDNMAVSSYKEKKPALMIGGDGMVAACNACFDPASVNRFYPHKDSIVKAVLLHEIGHAVCKHTEKNLKSLSILEISSLMGLYLGHIGLGPNSKSYYAIAATFTTMQYLAMKALSRKGEREADAFAADELIKNKDIDSLRAIASKHRAISALLNADKIGYSYSIFNKNNYLYDSHPYHWERAWFFEGKTRELEAMLQREKAGK